MSRIHFRGVTEATYGETLLDVARWWDRQTVTITDSVAMRIVSDWESAGWFPSMGPVLRHGYSVDAIEIATEALRAYRDAETLSVPTPQEDMRGLIALATWASVTASRID